MLRKLPILLCMVAMLIGFTIDYTTQRNINITLSPLQSDKNTAIYAAYSEDGTISDYVVTYLKKLKEIAPNIIYVTDNPMSKNELRKIKPYANHVIAHRHGEYDWGSFKRGYNWLMSQNSPQDLKQKAEGVTSPVILEAQNETSNRSSSRRDENPSTVILEARRQSLHIGDPQTDAKHSESNDPALARPHLKQKAEGFATGGINCHAMSDATSDVYKKGYTSECRRSYDGDLARPHPRPLLILANDSTIPLADSFAPLLADMQQKEADIYGITANIDGTYHIQSYFMILNEKAYTNPNFAQYLNNVKKEKDGLTVAYRYEVPFTQHMQNLGYKTATYIPYEILQHLPLNDKNCYPLTLISQYNMPLLKMRTFTNRLTVQEPRRLVFSWLKKHKPQAYKELIKHLTKIKSPYLSENK